MTYNREIQGFAPLPTGALPTQQEIDDLVRNARQKQTRNVFDNIRKALRS